MYMHVVKWVRCRPATTVRPYMHVGDMWYVVNGMRYVTVSHEVCTQYVVVMCLCGVVVWYTYLVTWCREANPPPSYYTKTLFVI